MMLATGSCAIRCTSQPSEIARSAGGSRESQYQQRPLPVVAMASIASFTLTGSGPGSLPFFTFASCPHEKLLSHNKEFSCLLKLLIGYVPGYFSPRVER